MTIDYDIGMYENLRRVIYDGGASGNGNAVFVPVCPECGRFVKADEVYQFNESKGISGPNATCKRHGPVEMIFEGWYSDAELRGE
jgi:hypothetical protein